MAKKQASTGKLLVRILIAFLILTAGGFGLKKAGIIGVGPEGAEVETDTAKLKTITQVVSASG